MEEKEMTLQEMIDVSVENHGMHFQKELTRILHMIGLTAITVKDWHI